MPPARNDVKKFILVLHRRQHRGFHTWEFIEILDCSLARARLKYPTDEHHLSEVKPVVLKEIP